MIDYQLFNCWEVLIFLLIFALSSWLLIANDSRLCSFEMGANTTVYLFGGEPFPENRFIDWNFVSSRRDRLQQAKADWIDRRFPEVPGETEFVPYPQMK